MEVLRRFRTPLERQINEALEIERRGWTADVLLNQKEEFNGTRIPRLRLESVETREKAVGAEEKDTEKFEKKEILERKNRMRRDWKREPGTKRKLDESSESSNLGRGDTLEIKTPTQKEDFQWRNKRRRLGHTQACPRTHTSVSSR